MSDWTIGATLATICLLIVPVIRGVLAHQRDLKILKESKNLKLKEYEGRFEEKNWRQPDNLLGSGWLILFVERAFLVAEFLSPFQWFGLNPHVNQFAKWISGEEDEKDMKRAGKVDTYLVGLWTITIGSLVFWRCLEYCCIIRGALTVFIAVRVVDILQTTLNQSIFNNMRYYEEWKTTSNQRNLIIAIVSYIELTGLFALAYLLSGGIGEGCEIVTKNWSALYFSVTTQFTIGFGDIKPIGSGRTLVILQSFVSLPLITIIIVRAINSLPKIRARANDLEEMERRRNHE